MTTPATYTDATYISSGTMTWDVAAAIPDSSGITVGPGATVLTTASDASGDKPVTAAMTIFGVFEKGPGNFHETLQRTNFILDGGTMESADGGDTQFDDAFNFNSTSAGGNTITTDTAGSSPVSVIYVPSPGQFQLHTIPRNRYSTPLPVRLFW